MADFIEVKTTFEVEQEAKDMAELLLDKRLVACAQILEINSHYVWRNERYIEHEYMIIMKTRADLYQQLETTIKQNHSYEVPEIVATKIENLSKEYADWIVESTTK